MVISKAGCEDPWTADSPTGPNNVDRAQKALGCFLVVAAQTWKPVSAREEHLRGNCCTA